MISTVKVTNAARRLHGLLTLGATLLVGLTATVVVLTVMDPIRIGEDLLAFGGYDDAPIRHWQALALSGIVVVHLLLWIVLLLVARRTFGQLVGRMPASAAKSARLAAFLLWGMLVWGIVSRGLASVVATWGNPVGERALIIELGTSEMSIAFSALIAGCMAHAFALGAELWRDHQEVI